MTNLENVLPDHALIEDQPQNISTDVKLWIRWLSKKAHLSEKGFKQVSVCIVNTHKAILQIPTPAVVQETHKNGTEKISNKQSDVSCHRIRNNETHKLL